MWYSENRKTLRGAEFIKTVIRHHNQIPMEDAGQTQGDIIATNTAATELGVTGRHARRQDPIKRNPLIVCKKLLEILQIGGHERVFDDQQHAAPLSGTGQSVTYAAKQPSDMHFD
jgi:hypothetical protein